MPYEKATGQDISINITRGLEYCVWLVRGGHKLGDILLLQNIISRIAHGLIGLDIFMQENERNQYLDDFLSINAQEISEALTRTAPWRLEPNGNEICLEEYSTIIRKIERAKEAIRNLEKRQPEELKDTINDMKETMSLFCGVYAT